MSTVHGTGSIAPSPEPFPSTLSANPTSGWSQAASSSIPAKIEDSDSLFSLPQLPLEANNPERTNVPVPSPNGLPYASDHVFPDDYQPLVPPWPTGNEHLQQLGNQPPLILGSDTSIQTVKIEPRQRSPRLRLTLRHLKSSTQHPLRGLKPEYDQLHRPQATVSAARRPAVKLVLRMPPAPRRLVVRIPGWRRHIAALQRQNAQEQAKTGIRIIVKGARILTQASK